MPFCHCRSTPLRPESVEAIETDAAGHQCLGRPPAQIQPRQCTSPAFPGYCLGLNGHEQAVSLCALPRPVVEEHSP